MKHLFMALLAAATLPAAAQMSKAAPEKTIGEVKDFGSPREKLTLTMNGSDSLCVLTYNDLGYEKLTVFKSVQFKANGSVLDSLYAACKSVWLPENVKNKEYKLEFNLGDAFIRITNYRVLGASACRVYTVDKANVSGFFQMTQKQLDKLFGRTPKESDTE